MLFQEKVWEVCKRIPRGRVSTYKEIAHALNTKAYRAVGTALNRNPYGFNSNCRRQCVLVPCHRVVNSDGRIGGFASGTEKKIELLRKEGVFVKNRKIEGFERKFFGLAKKA